MKARNFFNRKKRAATLLLAMVLTLSGIVASYAATKDAPAAAQPGDARESVVYSSPNTNSISLQGGTVASPNEITNYLLQGKAKVQYMGNRVMRAYAYTVARQVVDRIFSIAVLEQYKGGKWQIVDLKQVTKKNDATATAYIDLSVPAGYYYRTHGIFDVTHNHHETREEVYTDPLWLAN